MSKYKAKKTVVDGIEFDSAKEAKRYRELSLLERSGEIEGLLRQVTYELIPLQKKPSGKSERAVKYVADFVYLRNGQRVVEDVKGFRKSTAYAVFAIKRKLMLQRYGIEVVEI